MTPRKARAAVPAAHVFLTSGDVRHLSDARRPDSSVPRCRRWRRGDGTLIVLGCSGSYGAAAGGACSGYLLRAGGTNIWLDCGNGRSPTCNSTPPSTRWTPSSSPTSTPITASTSTGCTSCCDTGSNAAACRCSPPKVSKSGSARSSATGAATFEWNVIGDDDRMTIGDLELRFAADGSPAAHVCSRDDR